MKAASSYCLGMIPIPESKSAQRPQLRDSKLPMCNGTDPDVDLHFAVLRRRCEILASEVCTR
jgi:hypothetical protein